MAAGIISWQDRMHVIVQSPSADKCRLPSRDLARNTELGVQMSALDAEGVPPPGEAGWCARRRRARGGLPPSPGGGFGGLPQENFKNTGLPSAF